VYKDTGGAPAFLLALLTVNAVFLVARFAALNMSKKSPSSDGTN
jgi:hypothetical protein